MYNNDSNYMHVPIVKEAEEMSTQKSDDSILEGMGCILLI